MHKYSQICSLDYKTNIDNKIIFDKLILGATYLDFSINRYMK